jgi:hypothetical protein
MVAEGFTRVTAPARKDICCSGLGAAWKPGALGPAAADHSFVGPQEQPEIGVESLSEGHLKLFKTLHP